MHNKLEDVHLLLSKKTLLYKKYNLLFLSQVFIVEHTSGVFSSFNKNNVVKKFSLENVLKCLVFKLKRKKSELSISSCDYLFVNEVNNKPVIETLDAVENEFVEENCCELISDVRLFSTEKKQLNVFQFVSLWLFFKSVGNTLALIPDIIRKRDELREVSKIYRVNRFLLILNCFDSVFLINAMESSFKNVRPKKLILISDVHKLSRITSLYAKENQISSFVLQHGATVGGYGYLPVISDRMLVWGELSKKWFLDRGQEEFKLIPVGSPRMDSVVYKGLVSKTPKRIARVLVVMSEMRYEKEFIQIIRDAFVNLHWSDIEIALKLHPTGASEYASVVEKIFSNSGLNYNVYGVYDLKTLLHESDLVFVTTSSVGMEAIIFNKPILQFKVEKLNYIQMSYEPYECSHIFKNSAEVVHILSQPDILWSKLINYERFVHDYFYQLDGKASLRAKNYIENF